MRDRVGKHDPKYDEGARHDEQRVDDEIAETPRGVPSVVGQRAGEGRDEGGGHGPFGEQVTQQIRYAERHVEGVHLDAGSEERRQYHLPRDPEYPAGHRRNADEPG